MFSFLGQNPSPHTPSTAGVVGDLKESLHPLRSFSICSHFYYHKPTKEREIAAFEEAMTGSLTLLRV